MDWGGNMTEGSMFGIRPGWVPDRLISFESRFFDSPGDRRRYVGEGEGGPVAFVHGNPSCRCQSRSSEFRGLNLGLRERYGCVAMDHTGFGHSERNPMSEGHSPQAHAGNFAAFPAHLGPESISLYLADGVGPIGLNFARRYSERVHRLTLVNTGRWPVNTDRRLMTSSRMMPGPAHRFPNRRRNFLVNQVMPRTVGDRHACTPEVMRHYRQAQPDWGYRLASAALPCHIFGASGWLDSVWNERCLFVDEPSLVLRGPKDTAFRQKELNTWQAELTNCKCHALGQCGHFLAEEAPDSVTQLTAEFMRGCTTSQVGSGRNHG